MEGESNEWQRRIDELRKQVAVLKAVAESEKREQEAERKVLKSDLAESLAHNEAAAEQRHKDTYKVIMFVGFAVAGVTVAAVGVGVAFISVYLQLLLPGG